MPLLRLLFLVFLLVPIIEIYLLIKVGGLIGAIPTVFLVVFTAVLGALLVRHQGLVTLQRVQALLERGELPALELLEGLVVLIAGALLLTPGFFTDTIGFLCLVPSLRRRALRWAIGHHLIRPQGPPPGSAPPAGGRVLEGEFTREDPSPDRHP